MCIAEVFMYAWAAEHLMFMVNYLLFIFFLLILILFFYVYYFFQCQNVAEAAFNLLENNHLINFIKIWECLQFIIIRSQKPVKISVPCFLPTLSLNYFTSVRSTFQLINKID